MDSETSWSQLLNGNRRKPSSGGTDQSELRTPIERDHDRILFSTPVRRLADKTQVFPLERNDSVRNRLTHSCEVSNLSRSVGTTLAFHHEIAFSEQSSKRDLPALCAAIGLVHDLGNPPFGHQGESAIQSWFIEHEKVVLGPLEAKYHNDFLKFEGNAQAFRLVTRLQLLNDNYGLDLTYATLSAMMKYPTGSNEINPASAATKKHGFFESERSIAVEVLNNTGISMGRRHPMAYVMEACDDIAYVVCDVEDAIKKGLASISDLHAYLIHNAGDDELTKKVVSDSEEKLREYRKKGLSPAELNDVAMQRFRVFAIGAMIKGATDAFVANESKLRTAAAPETLMALSIGERLRAALKQFAKQHAYTHNSVLCIELEGYNVIRGLMNFFWASIVDRSDKFDPSSPRLQPFSRFVYNRISENYRRIFQDPPSEMSHIPLRYRECQLLTDMVSGMTDRYAVDLYRELKQMVGAYDCTKSLST